MSFSTVDVLIIGAGPAGLISAYNLSQAGLHLRIVDKKPKRLEKGQGDVFQIRGMEIVDSLGLASPILEGAQRCSHTAAYQSTPTSNGEISLVARKSAVEGVDTNMPFMGMFPQSSLEGILREAIASGRKHIPSATFLPQSQSLGNPTKLSVEQGVFPVKMKVESTSINERYPVVVSLKHPNGEIETVRAQYLLGCDGAHSWIRAQLGIQMIGETSTGMLIRTFLMFVHCAHSTTMVDTGSGPREADTVRFTIQLSESDVSVDPETGRVDRTKVGADRMIEIVKDMMKPYRVDFDQEIHWSGVYVIGQRLASRYQDENSRVFIIGDACHTHSPHAGQGMNAAINDAHNLSWKLVHVLKGWATRDLLNTIQYESERRGFAVKLIELHERIAEFMSGERRRVRLTSNFMASSMKFVCGVGTHYPASIAVDPSNQTLAPGIVIGERFPHHIILRTADLRPYSTLDLLKSDNIYKLIILTGDAKDTNQKQKLEEVGKTLNHWLLQRPRMFQIYTIMVAKKETASYTDIQSLYDLTGIQSFSTTRDMRRRQGRKGLSDFRVGPEGCVALVRPTGMLRR
ncbi:Phenol hydroxylase, C-terminal dimerization domain [Rhizoctonia solani]|uniref:Phenol hydroxylase, C-terminal dimerization domain n=1 Tax=Rhizoctonia solani TaxID=456999 RepID=A0A8H7ICV7_9AGAM|nr:Phenol hydroxylase, C-terminal dimerization domain [Rhizoctonia solani]